jgi:hypothetical protein
MADDQVETITSSHTSDFPEGLLLWAGHRDGGVKKPFRKGTGRPAGARIQTPLLLRLAAWAKRLATGEAVPTAILLVGGPGNGKTDAVDGLVEDLDHALDLGGKLFDTFGAAYAGGNAANPPRCVEVDLRLLLVDPPTHLRRTVKIVQDATEADPKLHPGKSAQTLLLEDLENVAENTDGNIYICCVNRGKLAEAYTEAHKKAAKRLTLGLLTEVMGAVTSSPYAKSCWPLDDFPWVAAWPMDIDSLVETQTPNDEDAVIHQILRHALAEDKWPQACPAGELCPFCTNRRMLSQPGALDQVADVLRAYELSSGKRWTFRDLYSLVPYMLVGDEEGLVIDGRRLRPCEWAARQIEFIDSPKKSESASSARALYELSGRLYWHRLFPLWPKLSSRKFSEARRIIKPLHADLCYVDDLFRYLSWPNRGKTAESVARLVGDSFCRLLDPADADPAGTISIATTRNYTIKEIDEFFSVSVAQGLKVVIRRLPALEREVLKRLSRGDDALGTDAVSSLDRGKAELLQRSVRLFASRFVKRSLGMQNGMYANREELRNYKQALRDPKSMRRVQNQLKGLINDQDRNLFIVPLMTTFAQPIPPRRRSVTLETSSVKVLPWLLQDTERPASPIAYLKVEGDPVPVTFALYTALQRLSLGMHPGSLSDEVFALVDRVRARVAGRVVRDPDALLDDAVIVLAPTREQIRYIGDGFSVDRPEVSS